MPSNSEVGHYKNVANLTDLIDAITGLGTTYNPATASIKLTALQSLRNAADASIGNVITSNILYNKAVNQRFLAFEPLRSLASRVVAILKSSGVPEPVLDDAGGYLRKLQGIRSKALKPVAENAEPPNSISVSQQSYDQLVQHFAGLVELVKNEPAYAPTEPELNITGLSAKANELKTKNNEVSAAYTAISNARIQRDAILYNGLTGLVAVALAAKSYVRGVFGSSNPQYLAINKIRFRVH